MGVALNPYGMYVRRTVGNRRNNSSCTTFPVTVTEPGALYYGNPVALVAGSLEALTATPTNAGSANSPVGIFQGCSWEDKGGVHYSPFLPNGIVASGAKFIRGMVCDDPDLVFMIQADGTLDLTAVGKTAALVNPGAGNASTGRGQCALGAASAALTATQAFRIIRVLDPGSPFPDVLVQWNHNVHQYTNNFAAVGT